VISCQRESYSSVGWEPETNVSKIGRGLCGVAFNPVS
jgi:hypothetical protein